MTKVRAIHPVGRRTEFLDSRGRVGDDGRMLYARKTIVFEPGTIFETQDLKELRQFLLNEAVEILDPGYDDLIAETNAALSAEYGFGPAPQRGPEVWPRSRYQNEVRPGNPRPRKLTD
jgi:hypothetical protein